MNLNLDNLIIEVTRRCNMKCPHCLRGNPQNKTLDEQYLRDILSQVSYISSVTFTGGEPTLPSGLKIIKRFIQLCYDYNVDIGSFYIVTNALKWRPEFPQMIYDLHNLCIDNEISAVDISDDYGYHDTTDHERNSFKWRLTEILEYEYGLTDIVNIRPKLNPGSIISEGRGKNWGCRSLKPDSITYGYWDNDLTLQEGTLYLNCNGNLINGCDWSYKNQEKHMICRSSDSIIDAVKKFGECIEDDDEVMVA